MTRGERMVAYFSGTVQGVGFRYTAHRVARDLGVRGYVRNLGDGRVEVVAEGGREDLTELLQSLKEIFKGCVRDVRFEFEPASGEFDTFEIRH